MSKLHLRWKNLDDFDRKIVMAACFDGSLDKAIENLGLSLPQLNKRLIILNQVIEHEDVVIFKESLRKVLTR